jgi:UDP-N-acetylmuramoylalanine--D-glutamate ligase
MNYTVIGAAKSGLAAALLAKRLGNNVFLTESKVADSFKETIEQMNDAGIQYEFGGNSQKALDNCDLLIVSPGVPPTADIIIQAEKKGIKIISELEFASLHIKNPIIAITGTNGKTTTTTLIEYILRKAGKKALACGNIGLPLSAVVGTVSDDTILVCEVSSFQLDRIDTFKPDVAILLNITPDHLYYHGTMEEYIKAKFKIFRNQSEKDLLILNADDPASLQGKSQCRGKIALISMSPMQQGAYNAYINAFNNDGKLTLRFPDSNKEEELMLFDAIRIPGVHNAYNSMAATLAARAFEVRNEDIRDCLMAFEGVEHRLEYVRTLDGVDYINDSKATNVNATWYALSSYKKPLVWIAGGRGDSNDYSKLDELVRKNVKCIIAIGEEADNIFNHFCLTVRCIKQDTLEAAVETAKDYASMGEIVLFTPACKSFDMFMNYEHRGEVFKEIVNSL